MAEENKEDELELTEVTEEASNTNEAEKNDSATEGNNSETENENTEEFVKKDKGPLLKKILIGVIGLLILILLIGVILYFIGFFDEPEIEEKTKPSTTKTAAIKKDTMTSPNEEYKFDISDINSKKLNKQLALLTNKNLKNTEKEEKLEKIENEKKILEEEKKKHEEELALEEQKLSEEKALLEAKQAELEKQKNELEMLKKEALNLKEQLIQDKEELENMILQTTQENETIIEEEKQETVNNTQIEEENNQEIKTNEDMNSFLLLINVAKVKGELYKEYLDSVIKINPNISLCRDDKNRIEIYYGPFESEETRKNLFMKLQKNLFKDSYEVELTKEEFNKRCKY